MDGKRFDELSRRFATRQSRRRFFGLIGAAAAGALTHQTAGAAPKEDKPTKCYGEGSHCTNGKQCCSSICTNRQCAAAVGTECTVASDCAGSDGECQTRTCTDGICGVAYTPYGFPVSDQIAGDCQSNVCNGSGGVVTIADDSDVPPVAQRLHQRQLRRWRACYRPPARWHTVCNRWRRHLRWNWPVCRLSTGGYASLVIPVLRELRE